MDRFWCNHCTEPLSWQRPSVGLLSLALAVSPRLSFNAQSTTVLYLFIVNWIVKVFVLSTICGSQRSTMNTPQENHNNHLKLNCWYVNKLWNISGRFDFNLSEYYRDVTGLREEDDPAKKLAMLSWPGGTHRRAVYISQALYCPHPLKFLRYSNIKFLRYSNIKYLIYSNIKYLRYSKI